MAFSALAAPPVRFYKYSSYSHLETEKAALIMACRQLRALSGTLDDVWKSATIEGKAAATPSVLSWREPFGLSHFVATRMVGRPELLRAAVLSRVG